MSNASDDLFIREDSIFTNKELLKINHLPSKGRTVGYGDEISDLMIAVSPVIFGQNPSSVLIYGKAGTRKPSCVKYVSQRLVEMAEEEGVRATPAYVDCAQGTTET